MALNYLSENLFSELIGYLSIKDIIRLSKVNRNHYKRINSNYSLFSNFFFNDFFDFDKDLHYEYGLNEHFSKYIQKKKKEFEENHKYSEVWKKKILMKNRNRTEFIDFIQIKSGDSRENAISLVDKLLKTLNYSSLPSLSLLRENFGIFSKSIFQTKLTEFVASGTNSFFTGYQVDENANFDFLNSKIFTKNAETFFNLRWYHDLKIKNNEDRAKVAEVSQFEFLSIFKQMLENQLSSIYCYLKVLKDPFEIIQEYNMRWMGYVCAVFEYEKIFKEFLEKFNNSYEKMFPEQPAFPKFSFLRLMSKMWIKNVYRKLEKKLIKNFNLIQQDRRNMLLGSIGMKSDYFNNEISQLLKKNTYFSGNFERIQELSESFLSSAIDLSLNEMNVHYLGHSDLIYGSLSSKLNESIMKNTEDFYIDVCQIYSSDLISQHKIIEKDYKFMKKITTPHQRLLMKRRKIEIWRENLNLVLVNKAKEFCDNYFHLETNLRSTYFNDTQRLLESLPWYQKIKISFSEEELNKLINYLSRFLKENEEIFQLNQKKIDALSKLSMKRERNKEIEMMNEFRKIPLHLNPQVQKFLDFDFDVHLSDIEEIMKINADNEETEIETENLDITMEIET